MNRRKFLKYGVTLAAIPAVLPGITNANHGKIKKLTLSKGEWKKLLSPDQFNILRGESTEYPYSSTLNNEKREGTYHCAGCDLPLFDSMSKYDSGTGWPSFFESIPDHISTKTDYKIIYPRTEYHCARCGGHQGHLFDDGPRPTGQRWCNNGLALKFEPKKKS